MFRALCIYTPQLLAAHRDTPSVVRWTLAGPCTWHASISLRLQTNSTQSAPTSCIQPRLLYSVFLPCPDWITSACRLWILSRPLIQYVTLLRETYALTIFLHATNDSSCVIVWETDRRFTTIIRHWIFGFFFARLCTQIATIFQCHLQFTDYAPLQTPLYNNNNLCILIKLYIWCRLRVLITMSEIEHSGCQIFSGWVGVKILGVTGWW